MMRSGAIAVSVVTACILALGAVAPPVPAAMARAIVVIQPIQ
ncbi:MAG: hypothetical protein QN178_05975 [Armatimonadota bacterium]|nr:hypothetical protein [Armatimonadota bacterium]